MFSVLTIMRISRYLGIAGIFLAAGFVLARPEPAQAMAMRSARCVMMPAACGPSVAVVPAISSLTASCLNLDVTPTVKLSWAGSANATYTVKRNGVPIATVTTPSYTDTTVGNATAYSYQISAQSGGQTLEGAPQSVTTPTCPQLRINLTPSSAPVAPGGTQVFTAAVTVNDQLVTSGFTVTWSTQNVGGSLQVQSGNQLSATYTAGQSTGVDTVKVVLSVPNSPVTATSTASVSIGTVSGVIGDVYSGGTVSNLTVDPKSVVTAATPNGITGVTGTTFLIPGYSTSNSLAWLDSGSKLGARSAILAQSKKLKGEYVKTSLPTRHVLTDQDSQNFTLSGSFNLNPPVDKVNGTVNPKVVDDINRATPEGQVWYVPGNLTIDATNQPVTFYGRGTIIVDGLVTLRGGQAIQYPTLAVGSSLIAPPDAVNTASLGIIVTDARGEGIAIEPSIISFVGAYFAAGRADGSGGTIDFQTAPSGTTANKVSATGLFVGPSIHLGRPIGSIRYDARISALTPPGFGVVSNPGIKETAP